MFKVGDQVICIDNDDGFYPYRFKLVERKKLDNSNKGANCNKMLTINRIYKVIELNGDYVKVICDGEFEAEYFSYRFRLSRKEKLKRILKYV